MAPAASIEDKFAFLLSCIRWGNNGVVRGCFHSSLLTQPADFHLRWTLNKSPKSVISPRMLRMYRLMIKNCFDPITANAAHSSKRFHRLMKEHGIYQSSSPTGNEGPPANPKTPRATPTSTPAKSGKKRKLDQSTELRDETDDEEAEQVKKKSPTKSRKTSGKGAGKKEEAIAMDLAGTNDESSLNESIAIGGVGEPEDDLEAAVKAEEHADEV